MGKKYLETKKDSLESSVLGVWQNAIEDGEAIRDAAQMTKGVTKEEIELDEVKRGTRKELEALLKSGKGKKIGEEVELVNITPDQIEEAFILLDEQQIVLGEGTFTEEQIEIIDVLQEMTEEEHDEFLDQMDDDQLEMYEGILGAIGKAAGKGLVKTVKRFGTSQGRADAALKKQQKKATLIKTKKDTSALKKKNVTALKKKTVPAKKKKEEVDLDEKHDTHEAQSGDKEAYTKFFNAALKKFKVGSPAELKGDDKKKFFDYIDKNWEGDNEKAEAAMSQVREFKIQSMKAALAKVWGMEEGHNPFKKKEDNDKVLKKGEKTLTGKKAAEIDLNPEIKDR